MLAEHEQVLCGGQVRPAVFQHGRGAEERALLVFQRHTLVQFAGKIVFKQYALTFIFVEADAVVIIIGCHGNGRCDVCDIEIIEQPLIISTTLGDHHDPRVGGSGKAKLNMGNPCLGRIANRGEAVRVFLDKIVFLATFLLVVQIGEIQRQRSERGAEARVGVVLLQYIDIEDLLGSGIAKLHIEGHHIAASLLKFHTAEILPVLEAPEGEQMLRCGEPHHTVVYGFKARAPECVTAAVFQIDAASVVESLVQQHLTHSIAAICAVDCTVIGGLGVLYDPGERGAFLCDLRDVKVVDIPVVVTAPITAVD